MSGHFAVHAPQRRTLRCSASSEFQSCCDFASRLRRRRADPARPLIYPHLRTAMFTGHLLAARHTARSLRASPQNPDAERFCGDALTRRGLRAMGAGRSVTTRGTPSGTRPRPPDNRGRVPSTTSHARGCCGDFRTMAARTVGILPTGSRRRRFSLDLAEPDPSSRH